MGIQFKKFLYNGVLGLTIKQGFKFLQDDRKMCLKQLLSLRLI
jgi:hypothetical protein